ncbi:ssDNA-binding domain-containing protein [Salipiger pacificus]|nr:ssDNA-binding domain-containing protein [Alloyangia pacifica]
MAKAKFDVYQHVTDEIIAQIEAGTPPWRKPWTGGAGGAQMPARFNGEDYRGINVLMLWATAASKGYASARWMTYRQAQELGAQVRKGETSATVVKFGTVERESDDGDEKKIPYCRAYRVFNSDQIDGLPEDFYTRPESPRDLGTTADPELEAFLARTGAAIHSSREPRAYYDIRADRIHMPPIETFLSAQAFYGTVLHELTHWSGAEKRLDRFKRFSDRTAYAFEELIAEVGACMLGVQIGVAPEFDQSASYVEGWVAAMKGDNRAIFRAASEAQKAVDFILDEAGRNEAEQAA